MIVKLAGIALIAAIAFVLRGAFFFLTTTSAASEPALLLLLGIGLVTLGVVARKKLPLA